VAGRYGGRDETGCKRLGIGGLQKIQSFTRAVVPIMVWMTGLPILLEEVMRFAWEFVIDASFIFEGGMYSALVLRKLW